MSWCDSDGASIFPFLALTAVQKSQWQQFASRLGTASGVLSLNCTSKSAVGGCDLVLVEHLPVREAGKVDDGVAEGTANWAPPRKLHVLGAPFAQAPVPTRGEQLRPFCIETDDTRRVIVHFQY